MMRSSGSGTFFMARHMLFATALAEVARSIRFKTCKRKDCQMPFAIESGHKRDYHTPYCGHLVSLRKERATEKRKKRAEKRKRTQRILAVKRHTL